MAGLQAAGCKDGKGAEVLNGGLSQANFSRKERA